MKVRELRMEGDLAYVPLTRGYEAVIDAEQADFIGKYNWFAQVTASGVYAARDNCGKREYMHRVLASAVQDTHVDHHNSNGLDNRGCNLRACTRTQNNQNRRKACTNTSGRKGVSFHKPSGRWQAQIRVNGKAVHLGYYDDVESAHDAYCIVGRDCHKAFHNSGEVACI